MQPQMNNLLFVRFKKDILEKEILGCNRLEDEHGDLPPSILPEAFDLSFRKIILQSGRPTDQSLDYAHGLSFPVFSISKEWTEENLAEDEPERCITEFLLCTGDGEFCWVESTLVERVPPAPHPYKIPGAITRM